MGWALPPDAVHHILAGPPAALRLFHHQLPVGPHGALLGALLLDCFDWVPCVMCGKDIK